MKTMTCSQMGGTCDAKVQGATEDEMMKNGMMHLEEAHPEMAATIKATPMDDPMMKEWGEKFHTDFEATPEDGE